MDGFSDLRFFSLLIREGSLAAAAQQMGVTPPAVSRRLSCWSGAWACACCSARHGAST